MSVVIRGMKMPKSCDECDLNYDCFRCILQIENSLLYGKDTENGRLPNCPLIELPPHGRMIDADVLTERLERGENNSLGQAHAYYRFAKAWVKEAPTVIEAEEVNG